MVADLGFAALLIAFLVAIYAAVASVYGAQKDDARWAESGRNAIVVIFPLLLLACGLLVSLLLRNDFSVEYVWRVTSTEMPTYLKVTALWGGQAGSLLFWNLLLSGFTAAAMLRKWDDQRKLMPYAVLVASMTQIFFLALVTLAENPFARSAVVPAEGQGLNPLLRHPGMIIHPPMLYLGFTGFTIPYTFAMAALITGKLDDGWIRTTRRWTLVAWLFLSLGLILGGRWAYDVLGWGGYWAWDPVENASFIPWLAGTAFLHSVMIQEKRNMFKVWNMVLVVLTYLLVIYGTFIVRSGVISSVHSFAQSGYVGPMFFGFLGLMLIFSAYWLLRRRDELSSPNQLESVFSREAAFLLNNFVFLGILFATFWGTNYPIVSELFTGERVTVGPPFYNSVNGPLFLILLLLMGVAPLTMWYRSSLKRIGMAARWPALAALAGVAAAFAIGVQSWAALLGLWVVAFSFVLTVLEFWKGTRARMNRGEAAWSAFSNLMGRNRRRYGGYWIHLGVLVMAFGIIGSYFFQQETQIRLQQGEAAQLGRYEMTFNGVRQFPGPDDLLIKEADLAITHNGEYVRDLNPRTELYTRTGQPMTIPSTRSTISEDFYVIMVSWEDITANAATFRLFLNPLINWVWGGGLIFIFGTLIAAWPDPVDEKVSAATRARRRVTAQPAA